MNDKYGECYCGDCISFNRCKSDKGTRINLVSEGCSCFEPLEDCKDDYPILNGKIDGAMNNNFGVLRHNKKDFIKVCKEVLSAQDLNKVERVHSNSFWMDLLDYFNYSVLSEHDEQIRADALKPIQNFIEKYDGAIIISDALGVLSGQSLIDELKEIIKEQLKGEEE